MALFSNGADGPELSSMQTKPSDNAPEPADRIVPRYMFEARVRIRLRRGEQRLAMEGWARDLSETGLGAFVASTLIVGELVLLEIPLAPPKKIVIPSQVARCRGTQYGFQFSALSAEQRADILFAVRDREEISIQ